MTAVLEPAWTGLVDDAAIFPPGDSPLPDAVEEYVDRRDRWFGPLVGSFVVTDTRVPDLGDPSIPLSIVVTGGAGAVTGGLAMARRKGHPVAGLEIALRDLDDLAGNARRVVAAVDAARGEGLLDEETPAYVELPPGEPTYQWLAAADEVAAAELRLKLRTGGLEARLFPAAPELAAWIDAAMDRETPFKCTAGLHRALRHTGDDGFQHHGFLNVLLATRRAFDGAPTAEVAKLLERRDGESLVTEARDCDLAGARRWFTSFGSCSVSEPLDDLTGLGLVTSPTDGTESL
jgi:hypothetical protein